MTHNVMIIGGSRRPSLLIVFLLAQGHVPAMRDDLQEMALKLKEHYPAYNGDRDRAVRAELPTMPKYPRAQHMKQSPMPARHFNSLPRHLRR